MQDGQSCCCFHQVAAALPFSCSSFWSAPPPARWGNSVLDAALCPRDQLQDLPPALLWEVGLSLHPCSQSLFFSWSLLDASSSFGRLAYHPTPTLSFYAFPISAGAGCSSRSWLVPPLLLSAFAAFPMLVH
jgi:hypothetical protein